LSFEFGSIAFVQMTSLVRRNCHLLYCFYNTVSFK